MATKQAIETAQYVRAQTKELARLSRKSGLDTLAYLLEVAVVEAETELKPKKGRCNMLDKVSISN